MLLDILATVLSGGKSTVEISNHEVEFAISQVFIAIDISQLGNSSAIANTVNSILDDFKNSKAESKLGEVLYLGERSIRVRAENLKKGIPVDKVIWEGILKL